jgi:hypothetical protein
MVQAGAGHRPAVEGEVQDMTIRTKMLGAAVLAALSNACGGSQPDPTETEAKGTVKMALAANAGSNSYRLNPAIFTVTGPENVVLDGSNVDVLEASLAVGNYSIELNDGWAMQQLIGGSFQPIDAQLLSPNPQSFSIEEFAVTEVSFRFRVGDGEIVFGRGSLDVKLEVATSFFGPRTNVNPAELAGWTLCFSNLYDSTSTSLADIQAACDGNQLMLACRPVGATTLTLAAHAPRQAVLRDTGSGDRTTVSHANGSDWYYSDSWSWGFAPAGETVDKFSCDGGDGIFIGGAPANDRLCFHTGAGFLTGGFRCGAETFLNSSSDWERLIYTASF